MTETTKTKVIAGVDIAALRASLEAILIDAAENYERLRPRYLECKRTGSWDKPDYDSVMAEAGLWNDRIQAIEDFLEWEVCDL